MAWRSKQASTPVAEVAGTLVFRILFQSVPYLISVLFYSTSIAQGSCTGERIFLGGASVDGGTTFTSQVSASEALFMISNKSKPFPLAYPVPPSKFRLMAPMPGI